MKMNNPEFGNEARRIIGDLCGIDRDPITGDSYFTPGRTISTELYKKPEQYARLKIKPESGIVYRAKSLVPA